MIRYQVICICLLGCLLSTIAFASQERQLFETGIDHLKQHRYEAAIAAFTELIELDPDNPDAYKNRGVAYMKLSRYDSAIQDFEKTKQMMPELKGLHSNLGVAWYYKGEYEKAITNYDMEIMLSPNSHYAYFNRAICWAELKEFDKSLDDIAQTLTLAPDFYLANCLKGDLYLELGNTEAARAAYEKALETDSEADYARNQLEKLGPAPVVRKTEQARILNAQDHEPSADQTDEQVAEQGVHQLTAAAPEKKKTDEKSTDPEYEIQTGAFQVQKNARDQLSKLRELGYDARILTLTRPNKVTWYLVRNGAFSDRATAEKGMAEFVKKTGMKAYVRPWNRF